jgi:hypothetical protein
MGVPITMLDKYNPDQFEILGITDKGNVDGLKTKEANKAIESLKIPGFPKYDRPYINGVRKYARILIRRKQKQ